MERSIENIWKEGFVNSEELVAPKVNDIYNRKSLQLVDVLLNKMKWEVKSLLPLGIILALFSVVMGNNIGWSIFSGAIVVVWYIVGRKQLKSLKNVDYGVSCLEYLKSFSSRLKKIMKINLIYTLLSVVVILLPLLGYTYFNTLDRNIGEVFGLDRVNLPNGIIFLILPVSIVVAYTVFKLFAKVYNGVVHKIDDLIVDMEAIQN